MQILPAGEISPWQQWGLPGVLLGLTVTALGWIVRWVVGQNRDRETAQQKAIDALQGKLDEHHARFVESLEAHGAKMLEQATQLRREHDERYQRLLDRMQVQGETYAQKLHEVSTEAAKAAAAVATVAARLSPPATQVKGPRT